ncbi:MAG: UDP-N-acetylmuramate dehydrogenase [Bacteroidota bacterium]
MYRDRENISLKAFNSFGIDVKAAVFIEFDNREELIQNLKLPVDICFQRFVLGGGSNLLFTKNFEGIIYYPKIKGIEILNKDKDFIELRVGAGEVWDDFVRFCVDNEYYGIENLSLIPGNVGASPVQNIGAFGVEIKDFIYKVETVEINTGKIIEFSNSDCDFSYRHSFFKLSENQNRFIVTHVVFRLLKKAAFITHYGNVDDEIKNEKEINLQTIRDAIVRIRNRKLPDPKELGNAGSFFKNPVVSSKIAEKIKAEFPNMPFFPAEDNNIKLAAGWLIDQCGWKGKRNGDAGVHDKQALVIVNYGKASGNDILRLSQEIKISVESRFDIILEPEVNIL